MAVAALSTTAPSAHRPLPCTWTQIILAMRKIGSDFEILAWTARKEGLTPLRFCELIVDFQRGWVR